MKCDTDTFGSDHGVTTHLTSNDSISFHHHSLGGPPTACIPSLVCPKKPKRLEPTSRAIHFNVMFSKKQLLKNTSCGGLPKTPPTFPTRDQVQEGTSWNITIRNRRGPDFLPFWVVCTDKIKFKCVGCPGFHLLYTQTPPEKVFGPPKTYI